MNVHVAPEQAPVAKTKGDCPHCGLRYNLEDIVKKLPGGVLPKMSEEIVIRCKRCKQELSTGTEI